MRKNKKVSDATLQWAPKFKFQVAKTKVLRHKIKSLRTGEGTYSGNLNILATVVSLHEI